MEDLVTKLIAVSPIAAALIIMAVLFLRYMTKRDASWENTWKEMSTNHVKSHESCAKTIKENTVTMSKVEKLLDLRIKQVGGENG